MSKLGFTFYPKDWWTSDTFFNLVAEERYIYLECIFLMYQNDGYLNLTKEQIERRLITQIKPKVWDKITQILTKTDLGYTHNSIKKRTSKSTTSRENGKKGGRPKKPNNPEINPPLEVKDNRIEKKENIIKRKQDFKKSLQSYHPKYSKQLLNKFYLYWTEKNTKGKKMRFEMQKVFDIERRLITWNNNNFNNTNSEPVPENETDEERRDRLTKEAQAE